MGIFNRLLGRRSLRHATGHEVARYVEQYERFTRLKFEHPPHRFRYAVPQPKKPRVKRASTSYIRWFDGAAYVVWRGDLYPLYGIWIARDTPNPYMRLYIEEVPDDLR